MKARSNLIRLFLSILDILLAQGSPLNSAPVPFRHIAPKRGYAVRKEALEQLA